MNVVGMPKSKPSNMLSRTAGPAGGVAKRPGERKPVDAFDLWLQRGLHQMFDDVAREPVPDELLRLIEGDRGSAGNDRSSGRATSADPPASPARNDEPTPAPGDEAVGTLTD